MTTSNTYYIPEDGIFRPPYGRGRADGIYQPRDNKTLSETEFVIVQNLKRAIVETHNGNYNEAEARISDALYWMYSINTGDK